MKVVLIKTRDDKIWAHSFFKEVPARHSLYLPTKLPLNLVDLIDLSSTPVRNLSTDDKKLTPSSYSCGTSPARASDEVQMSVETHKHWVISVLRMKSANRRLMHNCFDKAKLPPESSWLRPSESGSDLTRDCRVNTLVWTRAFTPKIEMSSQLYFCSTDWFTAASNRIRDANFIILLLQQTTDQ